jgi:mycothiol system anti-sigma-R factor
MNCPDCQEKLDRYVDRELSSSEVLQVQLHLEGCPDCSDQYEFQAHFKRLIKRSCDCETAPPAFREKLRQLLS